jgi:ribonuclease HI
MLKIYTDGACSGNPGPGGWAYVIPEYTKEEFDYVPDTTNNRMELTAVIEGLHGALKYANGGDVEIITDSQYVVNTMTLGWKKNKNVDLWQELDNILVYFHEVKWTWIKGHADNPYNKRCDELAVNAYNYYKKMKGGIAKTVFEQFKEMNLEDLADWFLANVEWINCLLDCADAEDSIEIYDLLNSPNAFEK